MDILTNPKRLFDRKLNIPLKEMFVLGLLFASSSLGAQPAYDYQKIQLENLGRGLVCIPSSDSTILSWRMLKDDPADIAFNVYSNGKKINKSPISNTTFVKVPASNSASFSIRPVINGKEAALSAGICTEDGGNFISIPLDVPAPGVTPDGQKYYYSANDASVGDVDGDGEYEIILKWDPSNSHDNSHDGYTGNVYIDCYKVFPTPSRMWRIDLGKNIRAGAHYTQFMVYDFDGDGKAELMTKTADGTIDGKGNAIGDANADYRFDGIIEKSINGKMNASPMKVKGRILSGPEYLSVFNGMTGAVMKTVDYQPPRGDIASWGDSYANRCDRFLAGVGYLDGKHPSGIFCRGYYTKTNIAAYDWDGKDLTLRWLFDSEEIDKAHRNLRKRKADDPSKTPRILPYSGQGNHNLRIADVDGDGCDEITYGSMAVNNDGTGLYTTGMGHGDALHLMAFYPDSTHLQVWDVHENKKDGSDFRDAKTGKIIFQIPSTDDVGRGMAADIDPTNAGLEMWSASQRGYYDVKGNHHFPDKAIPQNSAVWWDGDLLRELLDRNSVMKFDWTTGNCNTLQDFKAEGCSFNNGSKQNPCLSADILGDWREEVLVRTNDSKFLRIYTTNLTTKYRFPTMMHDIPYRISVATENVSYNQPPEPGFYFGTK